jgi:hypothetical protein
MLNTFVSKKAVIACKIIAAITAKIILGRISIFFAISTSSIRNLNAPGRTNADILEIIISNKPTPILRLLGQIRVLIIL